MKAIIFEIKKFKSFIGMEGDGFNAELWMDGKKAAFIIDDARGGEFNWNWDSLEMEQKYKGYIKALPIQPLAADAEDWEKEMYPNGQKETDETFLDQLINRHAAFSRIQRAVKKTTLFVTAGSKKGEYFSIKLPFSPENKAKILANPKNAGAKFLNEHIVDGEWATLIGMKSLPIPK
jgi:hypothetical protein